MSRFFPHSAYAEDQPYSYTILTTHVLHRGFTSGALVGSFIGLGRHLIRRPAQPLAVTVLRSTGFGAAFGTGFLALGLAGRMWDKTPIEWADRSWRLLENKGQVEVDDWSLGGAALGIAGACFTPNMAKHGWKGIVGGAGWGSLIGVGGYMVYRHGIKGGKWEDDEMVMEATS